MTLAKLDNQKLQELKDETLHFLNLNFIEDNKIDGWEERCTGTLDNGAEIIGMPNSNCKIRIVFEDRVFVTQVYYNDIKGTLSVRQTAFNVSELIKPKPALV